MEYNLILLSVVTNVYYFVHITGRLFKLFYICVSGHFIAANEVSVLIKVDSRTVSSVSFGLLCRVFLVAITHIQYLHILYVPQLCFLIVAIIQN